MAPPRSRLDVSEEYARALHLIDIELRLAQGERALRKVIDRLAVEGPSGGLSVARVSLTLAHVVAERGHVDEGLALLDQLAADPDHELGGLVLSQRGLLHLRSGRFDRALADLDSAVAMWKQDDLGLVRLLLNRGMLHLRSGQLTAAREDLRRCARIATALGLEMHAARAQHNLGYLQWLAGDLPVALAEMDAAQAKQSEGGPGGDAVYRLDRARVLFSAGLLDEADADLALAAANFAAVGSRQDRAECELSRAEIALTQARVDDAQSLARRARREFDRRGSRSWALLARLVEVRGIVGGSRASAVTVAEIDALASALSAAGLEDDARVARLVAVRARLLKGATDEAAAVMPSLRHGEAIPIRLYARELRADVARASGRRAQASAQLRIGLEELHRHQASFGSLDLQTAVTRHARALAARGLADAVEEGRAISVFAWSERARALASRIAPVRPPRDDEAARLLAQLRFVRTELRQRELAGEDDPALRAARTDLERQVRQRSWYASGPGEVERPVSVEQLRAGLATTVGGPSVFVAHLAVGEELLALVVTGRSIRLVRLGAVSPVLEQVRRARADLDALSLRGVPAPLRASAARSVRGSLEQLSVCLFGPIQTLVGDDAVLLVPSGALVAVPWTLLPALRGRAVTVGRSATSWLRGHNRPRPQRCPDGVLLASGPDLPHAAAEVQAAAGSWPGARVLTGEQASVDAVLASLDQTWLVHLAAHGVHEAANPLFSAVHLADGPLFGHDLDTVPALPHHVVLSACDLGRVTQRATDEVLGLTAAFLQGGTVCVLASVARVADDVAADVLVAYHRALREGAAPAHALAAASAEHEAAPFVCFGAAT